MSLGSNNISTAKRLIKELHENEQILTQYKRENDALRAHVMKIQDEEKNVRARTIEYRAHVESLFAETKKFSAEIQAVSHEISLVKNRLGYERVALDKEEHAFEEERNETIRVNKNITDIKKIIQNRLREKETLMREIRILAEEKQKYTLNKKELQERLARVTVQNTKFEQSLQVISSKMQLSEK